MPPLTSAGRRRITRETATGALGIGPDGPGSRPGTLKEAQICKEAEPPRGARGAKRGPQFHNARGGALGTRGPPSRRPLRFPAADRPHGPRPARLQKGCGQTLGGGGPHPFPRPRGQQRRTLTLLLFKKPLLRARAATGGTPQPRGPAWPRGRPCRARPRAAPSGDFRAGLRPRCACPRCAPAGRAPQAPARPAAPHALCLRACHVVGSGEEPSTRWRLLAGHPAVYFHIEKWRVPAVGGSAPHSAPHA